MKLNKIFSVIFASALLFSGCVKDAPTDSFENIKLDQTFLTIPETGGSAVLTVTSTEPWKFVINESWPQVLSFGKGADGKTIKAKHDYYGTLTNWADVDASKTSDSWLKVEGSYYTTEEGATIASEIPAGETKVTFKADATKAGREITLALVCGSSKQHFVVRQGSIAPEDATCQEVIAGPDAKTYRVKGVCTAIANTTYGNWYLNDGTGEIYIYGTLNANGEEQKFSEWGLEVGDVVYVEGPKTTYGTTVELVNVTVLDIEKSLLKVVTESATYAKEGDDFEVKVAFKGRNVDYSIPEEYKDWIQVTGISSKEGIPTKLEQNPADTALVAVKILPNAGPTRAGAINFSSTLVNDESGKESKTEMAYEFTQDGDVVDATAKEINAAEDGPTIYRYTGCITKDKGSEYGNIYVDDHTGSVYVYGVLNEAGESKKWKEMGIKECDIVTLIAAKTSYNGAPQLKNATVDNHIPVTYISVNDFIGKEDVSDVYYRLSGTVSGIKEGDLYGNFNITDETGSVYVYGLLKGWGGEKKHFQEIGLENGDKVTLVGVHASHNGSPQVGSAFLVSMEKGTVGPGEDAVLESIAWTGYTTSYTVNDTFKKDGKVTATYSDGATADVTADATFSSPDMTTAGEKTITVTYEGKETTGTITVNEAGGDTETEITFDLGYTATDVKTADWELTQDGVSLNWSKGSGSNIPSPNKEGTVRMYTNTTLTITAPAGKNITKVVFTPISAEYDATKLSYDGTNLTSDSWTLSSPVNSVVLKATANARFKKIVVTYK